MGLETPDRRNQIAMNIGHLAIIASVVGALTPGTIFLWQIFKAIRNMDRKLTFFGIEHELLLSWYCEKEGKKLNELPTRTGGLKT